MTRDVNVESIQEFLGHLDDLGPDEFKSAVSSIVFELEERANYQAEKHDIELEDLFPY